MARSRRMRSDPRVFGVNSRRLISGETGLRGSCEGAITRVQNIMTDFHDQLIKKLKALWGDLGPSLTEMQHSGLLTTEKLDSLMQVEQLTRFLKEYYLISEGESVKLEFDSVDACLKVPKMVVLGDLGQGKTTLLKQVTKRLADDVKAERSQTLPVFCSLATLRDQPEELLARSILQSAQVGFRSLENFSTDEIALFLDGFDEIQTARLKEQVLDFFSSPVTRTTKMVLSSRLNSIPNYFSYGMAATLVPFSKPEIQKFIRDFPWKNESHAELLLSILDDAPELLDLAASPLLLTLIVVIAQNWGPERLPKRKEGLYEWIVDLLLGEWDASKGVSRPQAIEDQKQRLEILKKVAYGLYSKRKRSFTREEFVDATIAAHAPKIIEADTAVRFFASLVRDCIIIPLTNSNFGFFHFSIQEYLSAAHLCDDVYPNRLIMAIQEFFRQGGWWEEVLVFYAGSKRNIGSLLEDLHTKSFPAYKGGNTLNPNFLRLLRRMLQVADSTDIEALEVRGAVAVAFAELEVGGHKEHWLEIARLRDWT